MIKLLSFILSLIFSIPVLAGDYGTGFFINNDGYIATAYHVIDGQKVLRVFYNKQFFNAEVKAFDKDNDIAILKINTVSDGYSINTNPQIKETVYIVGFPAMDYFNSKLKFSAGYIVSLGSEIVFKGFLCHGNSGGPLINEFNEVDGVLVSGIDPGNPLCFWLGQAVPGTKLVNLALNNSIVLNSRISIIKYSPSSLKEHAKHSVVIVLGDDK